MAKKLYDKKVIPVPLEDKYMIITENLVEYLTSLNIPAIKTANTVPVLALEVTITDERLAKSIELLVNTFSEELKEKTLTVIKYEEAVDEEETD